MDHDYLRFLATCAATQSCNEGQGQLYDGDGAIFDIVNLTMVVPLLFGLFWGAPLVAKELEDGTHNLAWTQGVTRRHWLSTNVTWVLLAAAAWGAVMAALVSWWRTPENALGSRFDAFDIQGVVPVAYSLFAVALGIAVGSLFRRVLPALAATLGAFVAARVAVGVYLRPHLITPLTSSAPLASGGAPAGSWVLSSGLDRPPGPGPRSRHRSEPDPRGLPAQWCGGEIDRAPVPGGARIPPGRHLPAGEPVLGVPGNRGSPLPRTGRRVDRPGLLAGALPRRLRAAPRPLASIGPSPSREHRWHTTR